MANKYGPENTGKYQSVGGQPLATKWKSKNVPLAQLAIDRLINEVVPMPEIVLKKRACRGMPVDDFFPPVKRNQSRFDYINKNRQAFETCWGCPVREQCLQHAMDTVEDHGIWGGTSSWTRLQARRHGLTAAEVIEEDDVWLIEHHFKEKSLFIELRCPGCGTLFRKRRHRHYANLRNGTTSYCTAGCYGRSHAKKDK